MQIDANTLGKILNMGDKELREMIIAIARERGLSLPAVSDSDLKKIRAAMGSMSPSDIEAMKKKLEGGK